MAFSKINNVSIRGIAACAPSHVEENTDELPVFKEGESARVVAQTGIERKHTIELGSGTTVSELCAKAFESLLTSLKWEKESIDILVMVSSAGDFITPPTSNVLHGKLGLPESCLCFDIRQGCPGWIVGMSTVCSMVSTGNFKRAILLCGDASTLMTSPFDKETRPLFSDAGTATALEFDNNAPSIEFEHGSRGESYEAIITPAGGLKHPADEEAITYNNYGENISRRLVDCKMDGLGVFSFGISVAPRSLQSLLDEFKIDRDQIDFFIFHQANQYMNNKIVKKLKLDPTKVPFSLRDFGNTSCASIPLTLVYSCRKEYESRKINTVACAFGVGLAWGSMHFITDKIACPELILY